MKNTFKRIENKIRIFRAIKPSFLFTIIFFFSLPTQLLLSKLNNIIKITQKEFNLNLKETNFTNKWFDYNISQQSLPNIKNGAVNSTLIEAFKSHVGDYQANMGFAGTSSLERLGERYFYAPIESIFITDDRTALYVLSWLAAHYSLPKYTVEYILTPKMYLILNVGDTVKITDDELGWENQIATINKISYKRGIVTAIFDVWIIYNKLEKIQ